ncbi:glycosyltransferase [Marinobacter sp.]|uniref:glycosyltransferase n=1 Tax=Marinobacter sp. TaxID=50741 RepID=UPI003BABC24C
MHILLLPSWYPKTPIDVGGVFFRDQAVSLLNYGHKVGVISPQMKALSALFGISQQTCFPYFENDAGIPTYRKEVLAALPRLPYGNYWLFTRAARQLMTDYVREHGKPDIIHAHSAIFGGAAAVELGRKWSVPVVLTEHSTGFARNSYKRWHLRLASEAARSSWSCISVSPALGHLLTKKLSAPEVSWRWIPNVVADRYRNADRSTLNDRPIRFLNLALMTDKKGQKDLLQAFNQNVERGVSGELWLAGDGPIRSELERLAYKLGVTSKVRFLGLVRPDDVPALLKEVDVMVISSHYETFGVVAAEALMAGLPVIATRCGGPECIVARGDGLLVPPKNPEALAEAMVEVGRNLESYDPAKLSTRAKERFSGPAIAKQLTREYERVLFGSGGAEL